ncbi:TonB-dependent receptor plug domain-containing protein, partial [Xanthomonas sacchari]
MASLSPSLLAVALAAAMLAPSSARAEDTPPDADAQARIRQLDAVQVQGSLLGRSTVEDVQHYAGSRQVIDNTQLRTGANRSLDDALQKVPGIKVFDETGTGALPQIMLRGLYESRSGRVQVLEDGIPLALAPYGQTSLSLFPVDLNQVDRIDIVRGGAAVQYGPNNVGGVINLISPDIPTTWTTTLGQKVTAGGAGHYLGDTAISTGGYASDTFGLQLDANWTKGDYWREHSATDIKNLRLRAEWWLAPDTLLKASVQRYVAD